jgi:hypothetical protein
MDYSNVVFHYTTGNVFKKILKQGAILPDRSEPDNEKETPTVTFSTHPVWEKTRFRVGRMPDGQLVMLSQALLKKFDGGLVRIVVPAEIAPLTWHDMKDECGMSSSAIKGIYDFAISVGARTSHWFATTKPVPEDIWITVEKMDENDAWVEMPEDEIPNVDDEVDTSPVVEIPHDAEAPVVSETFVTTPSMTLETSGDLKEQYIVVEPEPERPE